MENNLVEFILAHPRAIGIGLYYILIGIVVGLAATGKLTTRRAKFVALCIVLYFLLNGLSA